MNVNQVRKVLDKIQYCPTQYIGNRLLGFNNFVSDQLVVDEIRKSNIICNCELLSIENIYDLSQTSFPSLVTTKGELFVIHDAEIEFKKGERPPYLVTFWFEDITPTGFRFIDTDRMDSDLLLMVFHDMGNDTGEYKELDNNEEIITDLEWLLK